MIDRYSFRVFRWTSALTLGVTGAAAADDSSAQLRLSSAMSWGDICQAMESYPPSFEHGEERLKIMQSMDRLICYSVKHVSDEDRPKLEPWLEEMVRFYRRRVDRGLEALETTRVVEGVHLFKFYSSSVILKSAHGTVSLDFCQGPVNNAGEPEESGLYQSGFYLTREQRDRLARLVDVALITHRHHDHADFSLARRLVAAGRPVIGPAQLKTHWPELVQGVTVPEYDTVQRFGPCEILTQFGYQYAARRTGPDGERYGMHPPDAPERSSETVRYLLRLGGITFLQSAESQTEAYDWLEKANTVGWQVDVLFKPGQYQGARSVMRYLEGRDYRTSVVSVRSVPVTRGVWTKVERMGVVPFLENIVTLDLVLGVKHSGASPPIVYFDDFSLTPLSVDGGIDGRCSYTALFGDYGFRVRERPYEESSIRPGSATLDAPTTRSPSRSAMSLPGRREGLPRPVLHWALQPEREPLLRVRDQGPASGNARSEAGSLSQGPDNPAVGRLSRDVTIHRRGFARNRNVPSFDAVRTSRCPSAFTSTAAICRPTPLLSSIR
jgi:hypothetical protein